MNYYKITPHDCNPVTVPFNELTLWLGEYEYDDQSPPKIETIDMTEKEFSNLPEFGGF